MQLANGFMQLAAAGRRRNMLHFLCLFEGENGTSDNHIQIFYLVSNIVRYVYVLKSCFTASLYIIPRRKTKFPTVYPTI